VVSSLEQTFIFIAIRCIDIIPLGMKIGIHKNECHNSVASYGLAISGIHMLVIAHRRIPPAHIRPTRILEPDGRTHFTLHIGTEYAISIKLKRLGIRRNTSLFAII